jgi:hypothetical protein
MVTTTQADDEIKNYGAAFCVSYAAGPLGPTGLCSKIASRERREPQASRILCVEG